MRPGEHVWSDGGHLWSDNGDDVLAQAASSQWYATEKITGVINHHIACF